MKRIKSLPPSLQPREKILKRGPASLTTDELIAVVLNTGTNGTPVSTIARKLTKVITKSHELTKATLLELGLGPFKTAQVLAVLELVKRIHPPDTLTLKSPEHVYANCFDIAQQEKESIICFYLNARGELLKREIIAVGTLNRANLLPREIFSLVKELPVASIILAHNHPSGDLTPSDDDILFTKRVQAAGEILGVKLLDHLVVGKGGWRRIKY